MSDGRLLLMGAAAAAGARKRHVVFAFASQTVTLPASAAWVSAAYSPVSQNWAIAASGSTAAAVSSDGGLNWSALVLPASVNWEQMAADSSGSFVLTCVSATNTARGGVSSWVAGGALPANGRGMLINNGTLLLGTVNDAANTISSVKSIDGGVSWTKTGAITTNGDCRGLAGFNTASTISVASNTNGVTNRYSRNTDNNGTSWSSAATGVTYGPVASNGTGNVGTSPRFLAIQSATSGGNLAYNYSDDGSTWTSGTLAAGVAASFARPVWCGNCWLLVALGTNKAWTSPDCVTWTAQTLSRSIPTGAGAFNGAYPADTNGQLYRTIIPCRGTSEAVIVTTS